MISPMKVGQSGEVGAADASATPQRDFSDDETTWSPDLRLGG
jgi:hypothetical protein